MNNHILYAIQRFGAVANHDNCATAAVCYLQRLVALGFLARSGYSAYCTGGTWMVAGVLCSPDAIERALNDPTTRAAYSDLARSCTEEPTVERAFVAHTGNEHYCVHSSWDALLLCGDAFLGISPVVHPSCGGLVARFRLRLGQADADQLWEWDWSFAHVVGTWLLSGACEKWAEDELYSKGSALNQLGHNVATILAQQNGCPVRYEPRLHAK